MIKTLWAYTNRYRRWIACGILCSAAEGVFELLLPLVMADIVDVGIRGGDTAYILQKGLLMVGMALISLVFGLGSAAFSSLAGQGFGANLRAAEYDHIQQFSFSNIESFSSASLITRLTGDVNALQMTLMMSMRLMVRAPVMLIAALVLALGISLQLSRVFLIAIPLLAVVIGLILARVGPLFRKLQERTDALNLVVQENLSSIRVVKSFVREPREIEKFHEKNDALRATSEHAFGAVVINMPLMMLIVYSTIIAILWFGGHMVFADTLQVGLLTSFITYVMQIMMSLLMVSMIFMMASRSIACGKRVCEVLDEAPSITDDAAQEGLEVADGSVDFDHVTFRYSPTAETPNLTDISLHIASGQTVGILGGTGSGKTTLVSLIPRLYEAQEGTVSVGGQPVNRYTMSHLRDACAMVLQQNTLFSGTIRDNLLWGNPDATDAQLDDACRAACADEFLSRLPDGLDTDLGQGGVNVSGGQKQRLCIARAILKQPKILILDDSTSAVDTATDAKIRQAFAAQLQDTTKIIIAQRVASVQSADQIVVLDDGKLSAVGTHQELLKTSDIYREVCAAQQEGVGLDG
ncbi:MAG: ABC transporter ATP-binding protein [Oscillospiraceae bacterium]